jgi:rod shape determining protein RodA
MLVPVTLALLYVGGVPLRYLFILGGIGLLLSPLGWFVLDGYQKERILVFFDASRDPLGAGWNKIQSEIAVGSGGWSGKGLLMGTQNILGFLPRTVAPTDFIFSVIAEESGFIGVALVLGLYAVLIICGIRAALSARDTLGRMLAAGVVTSLFCHMFVNVAMTVGLAPITGLPLPLISYGGSFMVCTMTGLGLVQSVYVRRLER